MIDVNSVQFRHGERIVIDGVSITASSGRVLGLVGPNGAGKSTLLGLIYRLLTPSEGTVVVDGLDVSTLRRSEVAQHMAVVAQHNEASLPLTVFDSVALGRLAQRTVLNYGDAEDRKLVTNAIAHVGLSGYEDRLSSELSGGEWQRALIARAIVQQASHLLLDEPTNHLDIHHQYSILKLVRGLASTTVVVLHDLNLATQFCDEVVLLHRGQVVAAGTPAEVLTAQRVSEVYQIDAEVIHHMGRQHLIFGPLAHQPSTVS